MNAYPIVTFQNIIDMFHAMLFWKFRQKQGNTGSLQKGTFSSAFAVMVELGILPERRVQNIQQSKDRAKEFLKRAHAFQQWDEATLSEVPNNPKILFALRITNREMTQGRNSPESMELFSRTQIFLTPRGVAVADIAVSAISHLITEKAFLQKSAEMRERLNALPSSAKTKIAKRYKQKLDEKIWGARSADDED